MSAGSQTRQLAATGVINPQQAPAVGMVTPANQPFAALPDGATEAKRRRISPSKAQVLSFLSRNYFISYRNLKSDKFLKFLFIVAQFMMLSFCFFSIKQSDSEAAANCLSAQQLHTMHLLQQSQVQYSTITAISLNCLSVILTSCRNATIWASM